MARAPEPVAEAAPAGISVLELATGVPGGYRGVSGLTHLTGEPGGPPRLVGQSVTDVTAGAMGAVGVLAALHERDATGRGDHIDLGQIEALTSFPPGELVDAQINGRDAERRGTPPVRPPAPRAVPVPAGR